MGLVNLISNYVYVTFLKIGASELIYFAFFTMRHPVGGSEKTTLNFQRRIFNSTQGFKM